jgi:hypothetical protein
MRQWLAGVVVGAMVGGLVAGVLVAVVLPSDSRAAPDEQTVPRLVRAEQFHLLDPRGTMRAFVGLTDEGAAGIALLDQDGVERLSLGVHRDFTRVQLRGRPGDRESVWLSVEPDYLGRNAPVVEVSGLGARASLSVTPQIDRDRGPEPQLGLFSENPAQRGTIHILSGDYVVWVTPSGATEYWR